MSPCTATATSKSMREYLNAKAVPLRKSASKTRLQHLVARAKRGLPSYEVNSIPELYQFYRQRNLPVDTRFMQRALISGLEEADETRSFHKFMQLPKEMQVMVYEEYLGYEAPDRLEHPRRPHILAVSKAIRLDVLPMVFRYGHRRIAVRLYRLCPFRPSPYDLDHTSSQLNSYTPDDALAMCHELDIAIKLLYNDSIVVKWTVSSRTGEVNLIRQQRLDDVEHGRDEARIREQRFEKRLGRLVDELSARKGGLRREDMTGLRNC